jgi:hypothetical protein
METYRIMKRLLKQVLALFPTNLPVGIDEFNKWADSFFEIYDLPTQDKDSVYHTLAAIVINGGSQTHRRSKYFCYATLRAGAAKQIAGSIFTEIQMRRRAEAAKDVEAKQA